MSKKWIQEAISKPGSLRKLAKKKKLIKGEENLSQEDLDTLAKSKSTKVKKRVALARTLKKLRNK
ncbi:MAG: hypothetical protein ABIJ17_01870 [Patescibacteria group bacterium]